jgi:hypothetical protein
MRNIPTLRACRHRIENAHHIRAAVFASQAGEMPAVS